MTTANLKGGFVKTLSISRDGASDSYTNLKSTLLKKTDNYVCQMTKFITNITPPINRMKEIMFRIHPKGDEGDHIFNFPAQWREEWFAFRPKIYYSVLALAEDIQRFFHKFGFLTDRLDTEHYTPQKFDYGSYPYMKNNPIMVEPQSESDPSSADDSDDERTILRDFGWETSYLEGRIVKFKLLADGRFSLELSPFFASNFYIEVGPNTQIYTGLDQYLFVTEFDGNVFTAANGVEHLIEPDSTFAYDRDVDGWHTYVSPQAFNRFDHRLSLDVVASFPLSNTITVVSGIEEHEYLLSRFPLSDYKRYDSDLFLSEQTTTDEVQITEDINVGLEDLSRGNPNISTIFLLPGNLQEVNTQLWTRYFENGIIGRVQTDMKNGFWSAKLLFSKKQT